MAGGGQHEVAERGAVIAALLAQGVEIFRWPVARRDGAAVFVDDAGGIRVERRFPKEGP